VRILLATMAVLAVAAAGGAVAFYLAFLSDLPDLQSLDDYQPPLASHVYDRHGVLIGEFYNERRVLTPIAEIPRHTVYAFVASEDSTFFQHEGIDFASILRAAWVNFREGETKQGASTITQQMVKSLLLSPEKTYTRKLREMILAHEIERRFSKEEILHLYLNQIYFGHGAHGIGEAARTYFGKDVRQLSVSESALLAGLPKAPSRYSPFGNPERAEQRRRYVLERMRADEFIDAATYASALEEVPTLASPSPPAVADAAFFTEEVRRYLFDALGGDRVLEGGLEIQTTLDSTLQRSAVTAVQSGLIALDHRQGFRGADRRVADAEIDATLEAIAQENALPAAPTAGADGAAPLPMDRPLRGLVLRVEAASNSARIAFAKGVEAVVELRDVDWARPADSARGAPTSVDSIARVFHRGDVARFQVLPPDAQAKPGAPVRAALFQEPVVEGALLSIDVATGDVLALVGGYDFARSQFDRVTQARRQPGSSFKPFIYGAAISKGYTPASIVYDRPVVYTDESSGFTWRPRNYGRAFYGPITLRDALARSVNNATVHLFRDVGVDYVIRYARRLGIESPLNRDLSLALGSSGVSLLELTRAYATFPAGGRRVAPVFVRSVKDRSGEVLLENVELGAAPRLPGADGGGEGGPPQEPPTAAEAPPTPASGDPTALPASFEADLDPSQLLPPAQAYLVTDLLRAVVVDPHGTGGRLRELGRPVAGKTGTTNDQADAWFIGFSPDVATGVWVGHDETHFLGWGETGGKAAAPIWLDYMREALRERAPRDFPVPAQIVFARIDRKTGLLADDGSDEDTVFQSFLSDTEPTETAGQAQETSEDQRLLRMDSF
jgi:penicillin-binding protein 1A